MAELSKFFVNIGSKFDDKGVKNGISGLDKLKNSASKVAEGLKTVALAGAAMGVALVVAAKKAADAAGIQEKAEVALATAMKTAGTYTEEAFKHNLEYASSLQKITTFGDETILTVQKLLSNYGAQGKELDDLTKASLDFATATGMSLEGAAALVGKTIGSTTNALTRYGITVEGAVGSTERMQAAVTGISKLFGGAAQAEAQTYAGRLKQMQNQWGDLVEKIGFKVIPIFTEIIQVIQTEIIPLFEDWVGGIDGTSGAAENFGNTLKFIIKIARGVITIFDILADAVAGLALGMTFHFKAAGEAFKSMGDKFAQAGELFGKLTAEQVTQSRTRREEVEKTGKVIIETAEMVSEKEIEVAEKTGKVIIETAEMVSEKEIEVAEKTAEKKIEIEKNKTGEFLGLTSEINKLGGEVFEEDKKRRKALQPLLVAEATANTYLGATKALAQGGIFGILTAGTVIATGLAQVANISAQKFAKGVRNFSGGMALVGEQGPELVNLPRGSSVYSNPETRNMITNMGGSNIYVTVPPIPNRSYAKQMAKIVGEELYKDVSRNRKL